MARAESVMLFNYSVLLSFFRGTVNILSFGEEIFWSLAFRLIFTCIFGFYFLLFNVSRYSTRIEILMYNFGFGLASEVNN